MAKDANRLNITKAESASILRVIPVVFLVFIMLVTSFPQFPQAREMDTCMSAEAESSTPTENHTVLFELFTETWCPPCKNADLATEKLREDYPNTQLAVLEYHYDQRGDPFYTDETNNRFNHYYNFDSWPSAMIDGHIVEKGGGEVNDVYNKYAGHVDSELENKSHFYIKIVEAHHSGNTGYVRSYIAERTESGHRNLTIFTAIFRDHLYYDGGNGITDQRFVVRRLLSDGFYGHTRVVEYNFTLPDDSAYIKDSDNLGIVVFVQDNDTHEILQSSIKILYTENHGTTHPGSGGSDNRAFYSSPYFIAGVSGAVAALVIGAFLLMRKNSLPPGRKETPATRAATRKRLSSTSKGAGLSGNKGGKAGERTGVRRQEKNKGDEFTTCPVCGARVKKVNLESHLKRVHNEAR